MNISIMKHLKPYHLVIVVLAFVLLRPAQAQIYMGLHGSAVLPNQFYAESHMSDNEWMFTQGSQHCAGAGLGWNAGLDVSWAMPFHTNLEAILSADYLQNSMNKDVKQYDQIRYSQRYSNCSHYEMKLPRFHHICVMAGMRYCFPMTTLFDLYGEALAGVNVRLINNWTLAYADEQWNPDGNPDIELHNNESIKTYPTATTFAFGVGAGFIIKKMVTVGVRYCMLGKTPLSWESTETVRYLVQNQVVSNTHTQHIDHYSINPTMLTITLGFRLKAFGGARHVQDW